MICWNCSTAGDGGDCTGATIYKYVPEPADGHRPAAAQIPPADGIRPA